MNIVQTCEKALIRYSVYFIVTQPRYWSLRVFFFYKYWGILPLHWVCLFPLSQSLFLKLCFQVIPIADHIPLFFSICFRWFQSWWPCPSIFYYFMRFYSWQPHLSFIYSFFRFCHCNVILSFISFIHSSFGFPLLRLKWTNFTKWMNFTTKQELNSRQTWTICVYEKTSLCVSKKTNFCVHKKTNLFSQTWKFLFQGIFSVEPHSIRLRHVANNDKI